MAYTEIRKIASGGMGTVTLAVRKQGTFERLYAIKRLHPHLADDESVVSMFNDEARIAGLVRHPNVVSVLDVGDDVSGPYLVMEYVEGIALSRMMRSNSRPMPVPMVLEIIRQAAAGLASAHDLSDRNGNPLKIIHRDVTPQNILLDINGIVKLTDFGVAKALGQTTRTETGILKGKVAYMSPEQLKFLDIDHRSDLFSLGIVFFELLSGRRLYQAGPKPILHEPPPDIGDERHDVPDEVVALLFDLLAKDPEQRPASASEVVELCKAQLAQYEAAGEPADLGEYMRSAFGSWFAETRAELTRVTVTIQQPPRRRWPWLAAGGVLAFGVVGAGSVALGVALREPVVTPIVATSAKDVEQTADDSPAAVPSAARDDAERDHDSSASDDEGAFPTAIVEAPREPLVEADGPAPESMVQSSDWRRRRLERARARARTAGMAETGAGSTPSRERNPLVPWRPRDHE
ncbi:MAG: serine/threonine-protein kinase [Myxococcota bacterium]